MAGIAIAYVRIPGDTAIHETTTLSGLNLVVVGQCVTCGSWTGWWVRHRGYISDGHGGREEVVSQASHIPCLAACCGERFLADCYLTVADGEVIDMRIVDFLRHPGLIGPTAVPC